MSSFIGPNMYLIESIKSEGLYLNLDGGNKADGTKVVSKWVLPADHHSPSVQHNRSHVQNR
jgi:hypothetical protein